MTRLDAPELVRREYADESGLTARMAAQSASATGPDPYAVVFQAVAECTPKRVLEVGCGLAATSSERNLGELWQLVGEMGAPAGGFSAENGEAALVRHFGAVRRRDVRGTVTFTDRESARRHMAACPTRADLADRLPSFAGPLVCARHVVVFVCAP